MSGERNQRWVRLAPQAMATVAAVLALLLVVVPGGAAADPPDLIEVSRRFEAGEGLLLEVTVLVDGGVARRHPLAIDTFSSPAMMRR